MSSEGNTGGTSLDANVSVDQGSSHSHVQGERRTRAGTRRVPAVAVRRSVGIHLTVRTKDKDAAKRNRQVQQQRKDREAHWGRDNS